MLVDDGVLGCTSCVFGFRRVCLVLVVRFEFCFAVGLLLLLRLVTCLVF